MGGLGRLATWHLPGGPVCPPSRWATTSNAEVGQTTYPVSRVWREGREWNEGQSHKEEEREGESGTGEGPPVIAEKRGLYLDICLGALSS